MFASYAVGKKTSLHDTNEQKQTKNSIATLLAVMSRSGCLILPDQPPTKKSNQNSDSDKGKQKRKGRNIIFI